MYHTSDAVTGRTNCVLGSRKPPRVGSVSSVKVCRVAWNFQQAIGFPSIERLEEARVSIQSLPRNAKLT